MKFKVGVFLLLILNESVLLAESADPELLLSLKSDANHQINRLKHLGEEKKKNKVYDDEREKGLAASLEEQERWDVLREKGLADYKKQKKSVTLEEGGPEFLQDQKVKKKQAEQQESNRQTYVNTRNQVLSKNENLIHQLEAVELNPLNLRPRFDLRKRGHNKWTKSTGASPSVRPDSGGSYSPPPAMDYSPPPLDNYEEIPPPPPPPASFDGSYAPGNYDPGFGGDMMSPPPPPPPPPDYDF